MNKHQSDSFRAGFTLIELLLAIAVVSVLSSVVIVAVNPQANLLSAYDAQRQYYEKQLENASNSYLIKEWELPGAGAILEGVANKKSICKAGVSDADCLSQYAVPLSALHPAFIASLPIDPAEPETSPCTGYSIYSDSDRAIVTADHMGALPGQSESSCCIPGGDPYQICTCQDLMDIPPGSLDSFELGGNVDCSGIDEFTPIGGTFGGVLDGEGLVINNLTIDEPGGSQVGLFEVIGATGQVSNLVINDAVVSGTSQIGVLVGSNWGSVDNVHVTGTLGAATFGGGLVGANWGSINGSSASVDVNNGDASIGGLAGLSVGPISNSFATGDVYTDLVAIDWVGGLVGDHGGVGDITNCYATGNVTGVSSFSLAGAGGLVGRTPLGSIVINSYATGTVDAPFADGGLIGRVSSSSPVNSYWYDHVGDTADACVGAGPGTCTEVFNLSDFYPPTHPVYTGTPVWDFATLWQDNDPTGYPTLQ